jgi:hypothetical protein
MTYIGHDDSSISRRPRPLLSQGLPAMSEWEDGTTNVMWINENYIEICFIETYWKLESEHV